MTVGLDRLAAADLTGVPRDEMKAVRRALARLGAGDESGSEPLDGHDPWQILAVARVWVVFRRDPAGGFYVGRILTRHELLRLGASLDPAREAT